MAPRRKPTVLAGSKEAPAAKASHAETIRRSAAALVQAIEDGRAAGLSIGVPFRIDLLDRIEVSETARSLRG